MGRNNQNSKWSSHQQLKAKQVGSIVIDNEKSSIVFKSPGMSIIEQDISFVQHIPVEDKVEEVVVAPVVEESPVEVKIEAPVTILEPEVPVAGEVEPAKVELKPIVKKPTGQKGKKSE